ncbi:sphingomyelin phosphodiesterase [Fopius arisanus]|uniref:Sphingomyelin phosphodiesterase n=3 Tax=Fopius arisanus TaxID=64838 RepID=A0A9R1U0I4_9HYME|nr:PREDICTED: sphingomyelin phosphodiesterase-like [Fopius arisanus]XP_011303538.1 PREDICTED: sphingomyelin phosphodiesterase-like [Fopius arisanus]XP_011303539.1 PREDICTED: sphingomyelin phosphodiesterase-like [Fopius arisanus]
MQPTALLFVILSIFMGYAWTDNKDADADEVRVFSREISKLATTGHFSAKLKKIIDKLAFPKDWYEDPHVVFDEVDYSTSCSACKAFAASFIELTENGTCAEKINKALIKICVRMNIQTESVCRGFIELNAPVFTWIVQHNSIVTEDDFCAVPLQNSDCGSLPTRFEWTVKIDDNEPKLLDKKRSNSHFKIVHVSDIHYDPLYEPFGNAECDQPECCKRGQGTSPPGAAPAGYWGDYRSCDTPWHAVLDALDHITNTHSDAQFIYYTGDIVDHGGWETTRQGNKQIILDVYKTMKKTFGETPVYPIIGNHEANPLNIFAPATIDDEEISTKWLYELLADIWIDSGWLPECTRDTILKGGYYTVSPKKGFRIIGLNNNVAYTSNWWLIHEPNDLGGQLKWLADTLLEAEENSEFVHIITHVPSGSSDQQSTWSREYRRIINRFANIITGQFTGHTHRDEFNIFYDPQDFSKIINVAWNGGSITTWAFVNPNYRTCTINSKTYEVEDVDNWMYNMTEANLTPDEPPNWVKSYSFKDEYGLEDLSYNSIRDLIIELSKEGPKATIYHRHMSKDAKLAWKPWDCDAKCALENACRIVTSASTNNTDCNYLENLTS